MLSRYIKNLRSRSDSYKRTFALSLSLALTLAVLVVWLSVAQNQIGLNNVEKEVVYSKEPSPIESLKNGVSRLSDSFSESVSNASVYFGKTQYKKAE